MQPLTHRELNPCVLNTNMLIQLARLFTNELYIFNINIHWRWDSMRLLQWK